MPVLMGLFRLDPPRPLRLWQANALPVCLTAIRECRHGLVVACTGSGKSILLAEIVAQMATEIDGTIVVTTSSVRLVEQLARTFGERIGHGLVGRYYTEAAQADRPVVVCCNDSFGDLARELPRIGRACGLWIADEAHRTETPEMHAAVELLAAPRRLGCTATPYRSSAAERVSLFSEVLVRYAPADALRDGVICPWRVVPWTGVEVHLDDAVVEMIREHAGDGPGVVNATSIADAEAFAERLTAEGIPAIAVHSRLNKSDQAARLRLLEVGDLRAVVYPSLLSEGADFPWLRWMALRRKVAARVRFVQEVGRVLRTHPGKDLATILDPLGLFTRLSISYEEVVGWKEPEPEGPTLGAGERDGPGEADPTMVPPFEALATWASQLHSAALNEGICQPARWTLGADKRSSIPTPRQLETLRKIQWKTKYLPAEHAAAIREIIECDAIGTQGLASDLLDVLLAVRAAWRPTIAIWPPPADVLAAAAAEMTGDWHVAGTVMQGQFAALAMHGRRIVAREVRPAIDGDVPISAVLRAVELAALAQGEDWTPIHTDDKVAAKLANQAATPRLASVRTALDRLPWWVEVRAVERSPATALAFREAARAAQQDRRSA